jgi:hypothetical protein
VKWMVLYHPPDCIGFFQRMLFNRWGHLDFSRVIMESQYQRSRSTKAVLHDLVQKIEGSLNQKVVALSVFLDIYRAFDYASFGSMDAASGEHGVVLTLRRWIDVLLRCRSVRVEIKVLLNQVCPQGGVLSPLF